MTTVERSAFVAVPPADVWDVLADFGAISAWAPNVDHSCLLTDGVAGPGMVRRIQTGRTTILETVTEWSPPSTAAPGTCSYRITGLPPVIRSVANSWRLTVAGTGTQVELTSEIDAGPRPPQRAVAKVVGRKLAEASEQMLDGLSAHLESKAEQR